MFQDVSKVALCGRRNTFATCSEDALHFSRVIFANRIVSAARSGDEVQIPWQAWHFVTCHENRHVDEP